MESIGLCTVHSLIEEPADWVV